MNFHETGESTSGHVEQHKTEWFLMELQTFLVFFGYSKLYLNDNFNRIPQQIQLFKNKEFHWKINAESKVNSMYDNLRIST